MTSREFFWLVANMRDAQRTYFRTRDQKDLRRCKATEGEVDEEIYRVKKILESYDQTETHQS